MDLAATWCPTLLLIAMFVCHVFAPTDCCCACVCDGGGCVCWGWGWGWGWAQPQGWKLVWVPQDKWLAALKSKQQHMVRHDLLLHLTLGQGPFEDRIVA